MSTPVDALFAQAMTERNLAAAAAAEVMREMREIEERVIRDLVGDVSPEEAAERYMLVHAADGWTALARRVRGEAYEAIARWRWVFEGSMARLKVEAY